MDFDFDAFTKALEEDANDPNGYWNAFKRNEDIQEKRFDKFEKWLETNEFKPVFQKLLKRNGEERAKWCYEQGCEKYGTPLMRFVCDYVSQRTELRHIVEISNIFEVGLWHLGGYWFQLNCGQGCFWRIYDDQFNIVEDV